VGEVEDTVGEPGGVLSAARGAQGRSFTLRLRDIHNKTFIIISPIFFLASRWWRWWRGGVGWGVRSPQRHVLDVGEARVLPKLPVGSVGEPHVTSAGVFGFPGEPGNQRTGGQDFEFQGSSHSERYEVTFYDFMHTSENNSQK